MFGFFDYDCGNAGGGYSWNYFGELKVNMLDRDDSIDVLVTIPGVSKDKIEVSVKDEFLHVAVKDVAEDEQTYLWKEFSANGISRDIYVGNHIKKDALKANYTNGILTINVPKEDVQKVSID